jgi:two-component system, chemotaxis family, protein-glutamate methylesterase/glutaminase
MKHRADRPIRVLVVEDSRTQRELLVGLLQASDDFVVVGATHNGREAIEATLRLRPHVIAMDIHLPILDGYEATRQIMQRCPTPVVLISSDEDAALRSLEALAAGALAVVHKPSGRGSSLVSQPSDDERAAFLTTLRLMPEDRHILTSDPGFAGQRPASAADRFCPSADLLFESVARTYGASAIGLVMTGMGDDGTRALLSLRSAGAPTLGQDAASCVVYGMPRAALEAGAVALVEPLAALPDTILKIVSSLPRNGGAT